MKTSIPLITMALVVGVIHLNAAIIPVTSTADSGAGSMRAALASAANGDTIDASGVSGTILLTSGELLVSNSVTILGPGPANLAVNGNAPNTTNRVFHIGSNTVVSIVSLTITNGLAPTNNFGLANGGGIYNDHATLTVSNCTFSSNSAGNGGAVCNDGSGGSATMTIANSTLSGNSAGGGAAIYNELATLTVSRSTLSHNSTGEYGGGAAIFNDGTRINGETGSATLTIVNSTLSSNSAIGQYTFGGGIDSVNGLSIVISNCTLSGNSAHVGGGICCGADSGSATVAIVNSTLSGNSALVGAGISDGGAISAGGAITLTIVNSTLSGNSAVSGIGGGIDNEEGAMLIITNCTLTGNSAGSGGAIFNDGATGTVANCTFSTNLAYYSDGGGIYTQAGRFTIANCTLSGNSAAAYGGGIDNNGTVTIANCTLSGNSAPSGGGIFNGIYAGVSAEIGSTILSAGASGANITNDNGTVTSLGYNLSSDDGGGVLTNATDIINTDPMLGPLQDNGGPTFTQALLPGSPAIDKGKNFSGLATDQRGQPRLFDDPDIVNAVGGDGTDIGAYEAINLRITAVQRAGNDLQLSFTTGAGGRYVVESRSDLLTGAWAPLPGTNAGTGVIVQLVETNALTVPQQFYRVHQLP